MVKTGGRPSVASCEGSAAMSKHEGNRHAEDPDRYGCNLGHAERRRRRRSAAQGAAAAGSSGRQGSDRQVSGRQGADRQVSAAGGRAGLIVANTGGQRDTDRCSSAATFASAFWVTPVLRRAVTSTAQQQGWRTRPTDGVDQACLTSPGCLFVRSEAPRFIPGDSHNANPTATEQRFAAA